MKLCLNCNVNIDESSKFCPYCGKNEFDIQTSPILQRPQNTPIFDSPNSQVNQTNNTKKTQQQITQYQNNFRQIPPQQQMQTKAKSPLIFIIPAIIAVVLIAVLVLIFAFHTCDSCGSTYFGSANEVSFFNETFEVCDDCLNNVYSIFDF